MTTVTLFQFNKRVNSTKQPVGGTEVGCNLKEDCGIIQPRFEMAGNEMRNYNYLQWEGRYYWIDEVTQQYNGYWVIDCTIDALATMKNEIRGTTAVVQYAATGYNTLVLDPRTVQTVTSEITSVTGDLGVFDLGGTYYLSTVGANQTSENFCNYYAMSGGAISQVANILTSDTGILTEFKEYYASALETLVEAHYLPISQPTGGTTVKLGNFDTGVSAGNGISMVSGTCTITPPWKGNYLDSDVYTRFTLYLPFCGAVQLGVSDFLRGSIVIYTTVDTKSGVVTYSVGKDSNREYVATFAGNCMTSLPISTYKQDLAATVNSAVSLVQDIASTGGAIADLFTPGSWLGGGNPISNTINSVMGAVGSGANLAMTAPKRTPSVIGSMTGSAVKLQGLAAVLVVETKGITESITAKAATCGEPVFATRSLSGFTGFVQTAGASVSGAYPRPVINAVNAALDGGIYIE